jgi:MFS family permease
LFISLGVILITQASMSDTAFRSYGWRIPFLISLVLVAISLYIRLKMKESPIFAQLKSSGMTSTKPLTDAFTKWPNLKRVLVSLLGATAGQGVVWYTGQFFALFFLQTILRLNPKTANYAVAIALLLGMPFFTVFGAFSDRIGRKKIMMAGCLLAVLFYLPIYRAMEQAVGNNVVSVTSIKDKVTGAVKLTPMTTSPSGKLVPAPVATNPNFPAIVALVFVQVIFVCMVYGPIAAYLVEAFPARIRYTSLSLPYHIGNGVFGGLVPLIGLSTIAATGNIYSGVYYPMAVAAMTFVVGSLALHETRGAKIWEEVERTPIEAQEELPGRAA